MGGSKPSQDPSAAELALEWLGRKPLTAAELRGRLVRHGHPESEIEDALRALVRQGHIDDRRLALHYLLSRSARLGHGPGRLLRELEERGISAATVGDAWDEAVRDHGLDPQRLLDRALDKRLPASGIDRRLARRVYNALLRAGFEAHAVRQALLRRVDVEGLDDFDAEP